MNCTLDELREADRQIASTVHKLNETIKALEGKPSPQRLKPQITLARRRAAAFELALGLIREEISRRMVNGG